MQRRRTGGPNSDHRPRTGAILWLATGDRLQAQDTEKTKRAKRGSYTPDCGAVVESSLTRCPWHGRQGRGRPLAGPCAKINEDGDRLGAAEEAAAVDGGSGGILSACVDMKVVEEAPARRARRQPADTAIALEASPSRALAVVLRTLRIDWRDMGRNQGEGRGGVEKREGDKACKGAQRRQRGRERTWDGNEGEIMEKQKD